MGTFLTVLAVLALGCLVGLGLLFFLWRPDATPPPQQRGKKVKTIEGTVKYWHDAKGYGMITLPDGGELLVRYAGLAMTGYKTLTAGQRVTFGIARGPLGQRAINVRVLP